MESRRYLAACGDAGAVVTQEAMRVVSTLFKGSLTTRVRYPVYSEGKTDTCTRYDARCTKSGVLNSARFYKRSNYRIYMKGIATS